MAKRKAIEIEVEQDEEDVGLSVEEREIVPEGETLDKLISTITEEYNEAEAEMMPRLKKWDKYRRMLKVKPDKERKNFPFPNSSNVRVPVIRINTYTLFAVLKNSMFARKPFWTVEAQRDVVQERKDAKVGTKYMNMLAESKTDLNLKKKSNTSLLDAALLGFNWVKIPWRKTERSYVQETDGVQTLTSSVIHDGPDYIPIQAEDILYKHSWSDLQYVPYFFFDLHLPWHELELLERQGIYKNVQEIKDWVETNPREHDSARVERHDMQIAEDNVWDITEVYFYYDADGDGISEYLIFTMHMDSGIILRQQYNYLGELPFVPINLIPESFNIEGDGVGPANEYLQEEADATRNMRNDNMKVVGMKIFGAKKGGSIHENEQWYPGRVLLLDNPKEDFIPYSLGEVLPSSLESINSAVQDAQKAVGVTDILSGYADQTMKTRDSGVAGQTRLNQSKGLLGAIIEEAIDGYSAVARLVFHQLVLHKETVISNEERRGRLTEDELESLKRLLNIKKDQIADKLTFKIQTSEVEQTFEVQRQNMLTLSQLYAQWGEQTMPLAQMLFSPQGKQLMQQSPELYQHMLSIYVGSAKLLGNIFNFFGEEGEEEYLPDLRKSEMIQDMMKSMTDAMMAQAKGAGAMQGMRPGASPQQSGGAPGQPPMNGQTAMPPGAIDPMTGGPF